MPKIIENLREELLEEAKRQILAQGYAKTTIRSVAGGCGVAAGTVYNYFPSKEMLIATFVSEDWKGCMAELHAQSETDAARLLRAVHEALLRFMKKHDALFSDPDAAKVFASVFAERHKQLRGQLAGILLPAAEAFPPEERQFAAEFVAESLLVWTTAGKSLDEVLPLLLKILK